MADFIEYTVKVYENGTKCWYLNGKSHREDGPAIEYADGAKCWYLKGKYHREDGPACEYADGDKFWYLDGKYFTEQEFNLRMAPIQELTIEQIQKALGYKIKIVENKS